MNQLTQLQASLADRYRVVREIGAGGMATVFLARDVRHDRNVALKLLKPELGAVLGVERFLAEIRVTANLQHPNLLPLFDSGEANGLLFYVMPFVEGESLRARLDRERQLPVDEALRIAAAVAGALDYAHRQGVIHRDLKPENILLQDGQPVVADFGIALAVSNAGGERVTQTGLSLGTPQYMSPEQATGDRTVDGRTDQYSLAAVLYEMLTGEPPHIGNTAQAIIARLLTETARPVRATRATVPAHIEAAIARALAKVPADRFASTREFAEVLLSELSARASTGMATAPAAALSRTRVIRATAVGGLLVVAAVLAWNATRSRARSFEPANVGILMPTNSDTSLTATGGLVGDAIAQGLSEMPWVRLQHLSGDESTARRAGAGTVVSASLLPVGDSVQIQFRVVNGATGSLLKPVPAAKVARNPSAEALRAAVDPIMSAVGFVSHEWLGAATLPSAALPTSVSFRAFVAALGSFGAGTDTVSSNRVVGHLRRAIELDSSFVQARLWLGVAYAWYALTSRVAGGAARADTVRRWTEEVRGGLSPYETALADFTRSGIGEIGDAGVIALQRIAALTPRSPLANSLPAALVDLNRPREALKWLDESRTLQRGSDDSAGAEIRYWSIVGEIRHFLSEYQAALDAYRNARRVAPNDISMLRGELQALAALGNLEELRRKLAEVPSAASNDRLFGFAGDVYLTVGQELITHGHPQEGKEIIERAVAWFETHRDAAVRSFDVAFRRAIALTVAGRYDDAMVQLRELARRDTSDSRVHGFMGRIHAIRDDSAACAVELAWLVQRPAAHLQGTTTYERAAITANRGRAHWDEAVSLLEESLRQGQGFGIRRRLHYFLDWLPLRDYPAFRKVLEPRG